MEIGRLKYEAILRGLIREMRWELRELIKFQDGMLDNVGNLFVDNLEVKLNNISSLNGNIRGYLKEYRKVKKEKPYINESVSKDSNDRGGL